MQRVKAKKISIVKKKFVKIGMLTAPFPQRFTKHLWFLQPLTNLIRKKSDSLCLTPFPKLVQTLHFLRYYQRDHFRRQISSPCLKSFNDSPLLSGYTKISSIQHGLRGVAYVAGPSSLASPLSTLCSALGTVTHWTPFRFLNMTRSFLPQGFWVALLSCGEFPLFLPTTPVHLPAILLSLSQAQQCWSFTALMVCVSAEGLFTY